MNKKIVILPGDGIGKEVTTEGKKVLEKNSRRLWSYLYV